jgi:3-oxoacyl-[acyl-carrier protein] reductase
VTDGASVDSAVKAIVAVGGRLDIVVHAAGGALDALLLRTRDEAIASTIDLNLGSALRVGRSSLKPMLKAGYGRIVVLGSVVAAMGNAGQTAYAAAKAGLEGFTRSLAKEVGGKGITVNCVSPGFIETEMTAGMTEVQRELVERSTAVGRLGLPEDVAHSVAFFCEERASYVTGTVLQVGGGLHM